MLRMKRTWGSVFLHWHIKTHKNFKYTPDSSKRVEWNGNRHGWLWRFIAHWDLLHFLSYLDLKFKMKRIFTYLCSSFHHLGNLLYIYTCKIPAYCNTVKNLHIDTGQENIHLYLKERGKKYIKAFCNITSRHKLPIHLKQTIICDPSLIK